MQKRITNYKTYVQNQPNRQDAVWYDGKICTFTIDNRFKVGVIANGDIDVASNKGSMSAHSGEELESLFNITNDDQLQKALEKNKIEWVNNNWFEFSIYDTKTKEFITDSADDLILDNLNQALDTRFAVEYVDNYLEQEKIEDSPRTR